MFKINSIPFNTKKSFITLKGIITYLLFSFCFFQVQAQRQANHWAFGNSELDFNSGSPIVKRDFANHLNRGMGVISDKNGSLLFYTDGYTVWNKNHQLMTNGSGLMPSHQSTSTQESIIIPKPGNNNIFFIVSVDPWNGQASAGLYYSEIDLLSGGGLGAVIKKGIKLLSNTGNKISAALHTNQKDVWIITHKQNSNKYYTLLVTQEGISANIKEQNIGNIHGSLGGQLKCSPDSKKVAVTYGDSTPGLSLFNFDPATGILSNAMDFSFNDIDNSPVIEGLEFSSDATKIYTYEARYDQVYQFDIALSTYAEILNSRYALNQIIFYNSLRQFQLAPDGKIYITKGGGGGGTEHLGVIENPNAIGKEVVIHENGIFLKGGDSFVNYTPNFIQNYFYKTNFVFDNNCEKTAINFRITNHSGLDSVRWFFGEGSSSVSKNPQFQYSSPGTYTVKLLAYYPEKVHTISHSITINPVPSLKLDDAKTICYGSQFAVDDIFSSYQWNTGDTTHAIKIKEEGWYKLTVKNQFGCISKDSALITLVGLPVINLPDTIVLGELPSVELNPGEFTSSSWNTGQTSPTIFVKEAGWYSVIVENSFGCRSAKSVFVNDGKPPIEEVTNWKLLNPLPSNYTLFDTYFLNDEIGFSVNGRQLLRTKDGGNTWEILMKISSGRRIAFRNLIGYIVGSNGSIYKSTHFGGGWNKLGFNFTDDLNAISPIHQDTILTTSNNKLFISHDGGKSWVSRDINGVDVEDSYFTSSKVGHVACKNGTILKTINGGLTWYSTESSNTFPSNFFRITFVNKNLGFASQQHSELYKTMDGGETWTELPVSLDAAYSIQFINENIGFIAGEHGAMHKTTDGGKSWKWIGFDGRKYANDLYSVFFINENIGFATGLRGRIIKTQNGGTTWNEYAPTYNMISQVAFSSEGTGYARAGNEFFKTINKGNDWIKLGPPLKGQQTGQFDFINDETGFAIAGGSVGTSANSSQVYKTTDGGITWNRAHSTYGILNESILCIDFVDEMLGFVSGGYNWGAVLKTTDGGVTWRIVGPYSFGQIQFLNSQVGYARNFGNLSNKIYKTIDGGETWQVKFEIGEDITSFHFINESIGYFIGDNALMYKTIDGGTSWQKLQVPYEYYRDVKFFSADLGYILDEEGTLFMTKDGGKTWQKIHQLYGINSILLNNLDIYIAGDYGVIFKSTISHDDLIDLGTLSIFNITDSTATITSSIKSHIALENVPLHIELGLKSKAYDQTFQLESLNGHTATTVKYQFKNLESATRYYCRLKIAVGGRLVLSPEFSFTTPAMEIISSINHDTGEPELDIFPNPTNNFIQMEFNGDLEPYTYEIWDTGGQLLLRGESVGEKMLDLSKFGVGLYILNINQGGKRVIRKLIKK